jgi:hypothetical protein
VRISLDPENWAELKEVTELRRADRAAVNKRVVINFDDEGNRIIYGSMDDDMAEAVIEHVVTEWSLPFPVPGKNPHRPATATAPENPGSLSFLTLEQDDALRKAVQPHLDAINGRSAPVKENPDPTPASVS